MDQKEQELQHKYETKEQQLRQEYEDKMRLVCTWIIIALWNNRMHACIHACRQF